MAGKKAKRTPLRKSKRAPAPAPKPPKPQPLRVQVCLFSYGGVQPLTHACLERDVLMAVKDPSDAYEMSMCQAYNDALIDRCRATAAEQFLQSGCDVLVSVDHDLSWEAGDLMRIAAKAHELQAIVGGAVAKRSRGQGIASAIVEKGAWRLGSDRVVRSPYVGAAFTAVPRRIVEAVFASWAKTIQGFRPAYLPVTWPHASVPLEAKVQVRRPLQLGEVKRLLENVSDDRYLSIHDSTIVAHEQQEILVDYLSEDWAFCRRAIELGFACYVDLKPRVAHHGPYAYTIEDAFAGVDPKLCQQPPHFSLLHATRGRPEQALAVQNFWRTAATGTHPIEYIFSCDEDDPKKLEKVPDDCRLIAGDNRGCVDAYNRAAYESIGDILIQVHDDLEPPMDWDRLIAEKITDWSKPIVLRVSDGLPKEVNADKPGLLTVLIGTKAWFQSVGYFWHPSITSVFCDDHMQALAEKEGVIVEAPDIVFKHHWGGQSDDETKRRSYRKQNWEGGEAAVKKLIADGLRKEPELWRNL